MWSRRRGPQGHVKLVMARGFPVSREGWTAKPVAVASCVGAQRIHRTQAGGSPIADTTPNPRSGSTAPHCAGPSGSPSFFAGILIHADSRPAGSSGVERPLIMIAGAVIMTRIRDLDQDSDRDHDSGDLERGPCGRWPAARSVSSSRSSGRPLGARVPLVG